MRSSDYPYDHARIFKCWRLFRQQGPHSLADIDPLVVASWGRCLVSAPTGSAAWREPADEDAALISSSLPYLEDIYPLIAGVPSVLMLVTHEGLLLLIQGDATLNAQLEALGWSVGARCDELAQGTSAVSLSLMTAMPTQVVGAEHWLDVLHPFGGSAAPIYDEQGAIVGVLGLVTPARLTNQTQLALMMTTAQAISAQLQSNLLLEQATQRTRMLTSILESVTDGVITWDNDGCIEHANDMAGQILSLERKALLGHQVADAIGFSDHIQEAISRRRELSDVEASLRIQDRFVKCLVNVRAIKNGAGDVVGGIMMLRPVAHVRSLIYQQTSASSVLTFSDFEFASPQMHSVLRQARVAAKGASPVLLSGEAGVGKTALAQAIHNASPRGGKPLVVLNCSMIPNEFMVEELLGREAHGVETGRPSKFELADGGTLVLDEVDQLSLEAQRILLQVINSRSVTRLHAGRMTHVNVRIVATTVVDIETAVQAGSFLSQLYYLFNIFHLYVPPLRERKEDIGQLARRFVERIGDGERPLRLGDEALQVLHTYPWPGNVRELESVIERAVMHAADETIGAGDLPEAVRHAHSLAPQSALPQPVLSLDEAERDAIMRAGWACAGAMGEMARRLGIDRTTLWRKLRRYAIEIADFKPRM